MPITVSQITSADKSGIFDVLMAQINNELNQQFQAKRLSGKEYAEVYIGALTSVLNQSIQYVTTVQTVEAQLELLQAQKLQVESAILLSEAQKAQVMAQTLQTQAQKLQIEAQTAQIAIETEKAVLEKTVIQKQVLKMDKDLLIADKQIEMLVQQLAKSTIENNLLTAKIKTEEAQYKDVIDGSPVAGVIGKQKDLYSKQSEGFLRDAEQKLLKIMSDIWAIQKSTNPNEIGPEDTGMHDGNINVVAIKAIQGIGGVPVAPPAPVTP